MFIICKLVQKLFRLNDATQELTFDSIASVCVVATKSSNKATVHTLLEVLTVHRRLRLPIFAQKILLRAIKIREMLSDFSNIFTKLKAVERTSKRWHFASNMHRFFASSQRVICGHRPGKQRPPKQKKKSPHSTVQESASLHQKITFNFCKVK